MQRCFAPLFFITFFTAISLADKEWVHISSLPEHLFLAASSTNVQHPDTVFINKI